MNISYDRIHTIVTHLAPDFDALVSVYLLKRAFPHAEIKFTPMGSKLETEDEKGVIFHSDTGGVHHDHHHLAGYCKKCSGEFSANNQDVEIFLIPQAKWDDLKCPKCGSHISETGERTISSTFLVARDPEVLKRLPGSIKHSKAFMPLINDVNLWDNARFDSVGQNGKDLLATELKGFAHIFTLLEGFNILHPKPNQGDSERRLEYEFSLLDRLFHEDRSDLLVSIQNHVDYDCIGSYESAFKHSLTVVNDGAKFLMKDNKGMGTIYEKINMSSHNPKVIYQFFNLFGYQENENGWTGCSVNGKAGLKLTLFYEAIRKVIEQKNLFGNYPGLKGEDGEIILVAADEIVLYDASSPTKASPSGGHELEKLKKESKRISVNNERFKKEFINNHDFLRLLHHSFSGESRSYEQIWRDYKEESHSK